jgi:hypothetical protein
MSIRERDGLVSRIRQIRRASPAGPTSGPGSQTALDPLQAEALEARIAHLEEMVEGLQDSVYREFQRETRRIADLENRLDPTSLAAELSKHARERGL